jgi:hypothetical protein
MCICGVIANVYPRHRHIIDHRYKITNINGAPWKKKNMGMSFSSEKKQQIMFPLWYGFVFKSVLY